MATLFQPIEKPQEPARQDDGGPAFPVPPDGQVSDGVMCIPTRADPGMSLRDYFAAGAMRSLVNLSMNGDVPMDDDGREDARLVAENSYAVADAMLKARVAK